MFSVQKYFLCIHIKCVYNEDNSLRLCFWQGQDFCTFWVEFRVITILKRPEHIRKFVLTIGLWKFSWIHHIKENTCSLNLNAICIHSMYFLCPHTNASHSLFRAVSVCLHPYYKYLKTKKHVCQTWLCLVYEHFAYTRIMFLQCALLWVAFSSFLKVIA